MQRRAARLHELLPRTRFLRSVVCNAARVGVVISTFMLVGNVAAALPGVSETTGLVITPTSGDSGTTVSVQVVPSDRRCPAAADGSGARWNSFLVPDSVDPSDVRFGAFGPFLASGDVTIGPVMPLASADDGRPLVHVPTSADGRMDPAPPVGFRHLVPGELPSGVYRLGFACTTTFDRTDSSTAARIWSIAITIEQRDDAGPADFVWNVGSEPPRPPAVAPALLTPGSTTTTSVPSDPSADGGSLLETAVGSQGVSQGVLVVVPPAGPTTTTSVPPVPTSTAPAPTTTVVASGGPTTTVAGAATTTTVVVASRPPGGQVGGGGGATGGSGGSGGRFPITGSDAARILVWAFTLMVFGRIAIVAARPSRDRADDRE